MTEPLRSYIQQDAISWLRGYDSDDRSLGDVLAYWDIDELNFDYRNFGVCADCEVWEYRNPYGLCGECAKNGG